MRKQRLRRGTKTLPFREGWRAARAGLGLLLLCLVSCKATTDDFHTWGAYDTTRVRLGDTCRAVDGGCFTAASTTLLTIGVHANDPTKAVLKRASNSEVTGTQSGSRFQFEIDTSQGGIKQTICGCDAYAKETIWGELYTANSDAGPELDGGVPSCDGGDFCAWWVEQAPCGTDPGLSAGDWIDGGTSVDLNAQYTSFSATLVDELTVAPGQGDCPCLPCRVTYQLSGKL